MLAVSQALLALPSDHSGSLFKPCGSFLTFRGWVGLPVGSDQWATTCSLLSTCTPRLTSEVEELNVSLAALKEKLLEAEQSLLNLEDTRMALEKDMAVKANSLTIDRQHCLAHRTHYPTVLQLSGYD